MWDYNCYLGHYYRWYRIREWHKSGACVSNIHLYDFSVTYRIPEEKESTDNMLGACLCCAICILSSSRGLDTYGFFDNNREQRITSSCTMTAYAGSEIAYLSYITLQKSCYYTYLVVLSHKLCDIDLV